MNSSTVALHGVTKMYGRSPALDRVDLMLGVGITGLLGPNGAGKTTFLRILATVLRPTDGTCRVLGLDPFQPGQRTDIRRRLGYLPQESGYPRGFTAFRYVDYLAALKEWTDRAARHAEVRNGCSTWSACPTSRASACARCRAASAAGSRWPRPCSGSPSCSSSTSPPPGSTPSSVPRSAASSPEPGHHATVVLATHQTEDVAALCERVVVLDAGRVLLRRTGDASSSPRPAAGCGWPTARTDARIVAWRTGTGRYRHVGHHPPAGAELTEPTLEDAYLLLRGVPRHDLDEVHQ